MATKKKATPETDNQYFIKAPYNQKPALLARVSGERVNLLGEEHTVTIKGTGGKADKEVTYRGATQAELGFLYENIEVVGNYRKMIGKRIDAEEAKAEATDSTGTDGTGGTA